MEIEKIVSTVQEKIGNTDFSAQTIQKYVELNPVADGQDPDDAYYAKAVGFFQGMQGQFNHDFSTKFKEAKKNLLTEDTFKNMSAEQIAEIKQLLSGLSPNEGGGDSDEVKTLKEQIVKLTERLDSDDIAKRNAELKNKVKAAMKEQFANDDYVLEKTLENAVFDEKKSIEDITKEYLVKYDSEYLRCRGGGTPPRQGFGGGNGEETWLDKKFKQKAEKEGWGKR